mmetsp:Transcript_30990/g.78370  ORF Transcript_30990/g.78370 Transcript_30990/m.78370 type:complete len:279 (+) Transcript_30990:629-1465(+)
MRGRHEGRVDSNDIAGAENLVKFDVLDAHFLNDRALEHVVRDDVAFVPPLEDRRRDLADLPGADDTDLLPGHVEAELAIEAEITGAGLRPCLRNAAVQRRHEGDRVLRHGVRAVRRDAAHTDAELLCFIEVHIVEAGTPESDQLDVETMKRFDTLLIDLVVDEHDNRIASLGQRRRLRAQLHVVAHKLDARAERPIHRNKGITVVLLARKDRHSQRQQATTLRLHESLLPGRRAWNVCRKDDLVLEPGRPSVAHQVLHAVGPAHLDDVRRGLLQCGLQ